MGVRVCASKRERERMSERERERDVVANASDLGYISLVRAHTACTYKQRPKLLTINFLTGCNYLILEIKSRYANYEKLLINIVYIGCVCVCDCRLPSMLRLYVHYAISALFPFPFRINFAFPFSLSLLF